MVSIAVWRTINHLSAIPDSSSKVLKNGDGVVPVNASISDADTLLQGGWAFGRYLLVALIDVGLNHDANDGSLALAELISNDLSNLGLVAVVLIGVACMCQGAAYVMSTRWGFLPWEQSTIIAIF